MTATERPEPQELIRRSYAAFNSREIETALAGMHPDVDWPNALDGSRVKGREAVRRYWLSQFEVSDPHVEPRGFDEDARGRIVVTVDQTLRDLDGKVLDERTVRHVYTLRAGLVAHMEISDVRAPW